MSIAADGLPLLAILSAGGTPREIAPAVLPFPQALAAHPTDAIFAVMEGGGRETWHHKAIVEINLATGARRVWSPPGQVGLSPQWSPDGRRLAYVGAPDRGEEGGPETLAERRIWVVERASARAWKVAEDPAFRDEWPRWSADGAYLLVVRLQGAMAALWVLRADGACGQPLVSGLRPPEVFPGAPPERGFYGWVDWSQVLDFLPAR